MVNHQESENIPIPDKEELLHTYWGLHKEIHPHNLLPLESELPLELRWDHRDKYRIIMTMILSGGIKDKSLARGLGKLFRGSPAFESLRKLEKHHIKQLLSLSGIGYNDPDRGGNGGRLWSFHLCYFGPWKETINEGNIQKLNQVKGFGGGKFTRTIQAYYCGSKDVLPLDRPALSAIYDPLFPGYRNSSDEEIRKDIESKLHGESGVSLIDFHEMLRYCGQTDGKSQTEKNDIIIGWNAWRLLCSSNREYITKDWIHKNLVKDESIADSLWQFYKEITGKG